MHSRCVVNGRRDGSTVFREFLRRVESDISKLRNLVLNSPALLVELFILSLKLLEPCFADRLRSIHVRNWRIC